MKFVELIKRRRSKTTDNDFSVKDININITEDGVLLSEEDFKSLLQKVNDMELTIEEHKNEIEHLMELSDVYLTIQNNTRKSKLKPIYRIIFNK